jgi:hypothetical protein
MKYKLPQLSWLLTTAMLISYGWVNDVSAAENDTLSLTSSTCTLESLPMYPDVRITSVTPKTTPVSHCNVTGVIGAETGFELLLPGNWNGKFVMGGGAGFVGQIINSALPYGALQSGYATVGTDAGHSGHPAAADWAYNNLERLVSFGHQAVHRTAVTSKAIIADYYQKNIERSYFAGCSGFRRNCCGSTGLQLDARPGCGRHGHQSCHVSGSPQFAESDYRAAGSKSHRIRIHGPM